MIGRTHAKKEIMRLSSANFFPRHPQGVSELVDAIQLGSRTNEHATLVISEALSSSSACPTPADIKTLCAETNRKAEKYPEACEECKPHGGNWRMMTIRGIEAATRCDCPRGVLLAQREEQHRMESAK